MRYDYTTIGHVTVDELPDGTRRPGGGAFYSALQASRLGLRTLVVTRGVPDEIAELTATFAAEIDLRVEPAAATTVLATRALTGPRDQRVVSWAGPMAARPTVDSRIVHFAPVAAECPATCSGACAFVAFTPQGVTRRWGPDGRFAHTRAPGRFVPLARRCDAIVLNARELPHCAALVGAAREAGAVIAVTDESGPARVITGDAEHTVAAARVDAPVDDLGAGDVYAAALFTELAAGLDVLAAARFASAAAALRVAGAGARAVPSRPEIGRALSSAEG
ncbi:MAG TPA: PfkB family carbohydrate kinase [Solirubrobacteraceae bacterium]|nr:PfkB family carbohydrate kinase [Solirubrobacteraceae bacterium]